MLPILIVQDAISVWTYRRAWSAWNLKVLCAARTHRHRRRRAVRNLRVRTPHRAAASSAVFSPRARCSGTGRPPAQTQQPTASALRRILGRAFGLHVAAVKAGAPPYQLYILPQRLRKADVRRHHHISSPHERDEDRALFRARPVLDAQFRDLGGCCCRSPSRPIFSASGWCAKRRPRRSTASLTG